MQSLGVQGPPGRDLANIDPHERRRRIRHVAQPFERRLRRAGVLFRVDEPERMLDELTLDGARAITSVSPLPARPAAPPAAPETDYDPGLDRSP